MLDMFKDHLAFAAKVNLMFMEINRNDHWITETQINTNNVFTDAYHYTFY